MAILMDAAFPLFIRTTSPAVVLKGRDVMKTVEIMQQLLTDAQFIDMTRIMEEGMPFWPTQPAFQAETIESQELGNESYFRKIIMCEHTGTHIDAGCHFVPGKPGIDEMPLTQIIGRALNIDATDTKPCGLAHIDAVKRFEENHGEVRKGDIVFFRFGWDEKYGTDAYMKDWPGLSLEAGQYLHKKGVKAVGCDCMALDAFGSTNPNHSYLLGNDINILENIDNLGILPPAFSVIGLPCKFKNGSGSPIRLLAVLDKEK